MTRARERGFGLIELLMALVVLSIGVLALSAAIPLGLNRIGASHEHTEASELASECAEQLLDTPYFDDDLEAGDHTDPGNPHLNNYYVLWTVEDDQPMVDCKRVTITIH
ncbi:MAG TPA: prepilin-type N-terminal cleavage/methylation domain-containing protein, partial [Dongiaceae bacterium]|nr:prepilin-type N-terminal cleavage/methylation domain-containing protein [Dongiaceae bacterium]